MPDYANMTAFQSPSELSAFLFYSTEVSKAKTRARRFGSGCEPHLWFNQTPDCGTDLLAGGNNMELPVANQNIYSAIQTIFDEKIPFNKVLGLRIESLLVDHPRLRFDMRDELIGNYQRGTLHGGVISSVIDVTGGLVAFLRAMKSDEESSPEKEPGIFAKPGTIDQRVDCLRSGSGIWFVSTVYMLRTGRKVAATLIELSPRQERPDCCRNRGLCHRPGACPDVWVVRSSIQGCVSVP